MEFQNIKYGRLCLPRWTFSAHTFYCTNTGPLSLLKTLQASVASRPCSPPGLNVPPLCYLGQQGLFSAPSTFCPAASSCTAGAAALSPVTLVVWPFSPRWPHFSVRFWESESLPGSSVCGSLGLSLTSEHGSPLCLSPPWRILECIRLYVRSLAPDRVNKPSGSGEASGECLEEGGLTIDRNTCPGLNGALSIVML